ncbi:MAG: hypothetical protein Q4A71_04730 [Actinomycetaceae bacterium]|nr:hypothetical protein [Actinomycetaceae bacterium]
MRKKYGNFSDSWKGRAKFWRGRGVRGCAGCAGIWEGAEVGGRLDRMWRNAANGGRGAVGLDRARCP